MKNCLFLLIYVFPFLCTAQIVNLYDATYDDPEGTYYKDVNNDLDKFIGTWMWEQNDSIFTIILQKKEYVNNTTFNHYEDMIVGEYKLNVNGDIIIDYLSRLQNETIFGRQNYISGNILLAKNDLPKCEECNPSEIRLQVSFIDPEREYIPCSLLLRHQTINGVEQLTALLIEAGSYAIESENQPTTIRIPYGEYLLIKQ